MPPARRSLASRVALATGLAAAVAASLSAAAAIGISERLVLAAEDRRLRETAEIAVREIRAAPDRDAAIAEEIAELTPEGLRIAVHDGEVLAGGDPTLPRLEAGACTSPDGARSRACAFGPATLRVVVGMVLTPGNPRALFGAVGLAVLASAALAALLARRTTRWALGPLTRLTASLGSLEDAAPAALAGADTTREVAALRAALADLVSRLATSLGASRRFAADAAHELKTPLTVLRAELELLEEGPLPADVRTVVAKLRRRTVALGTLVERLLVLARAGERLVVDGETVALEDVAREAVERLPAERRERVTVAADAPGMVRGDEALLGALVDNALDNALKFSTEPVTIQVLETERDAVLEVSDRGPGVPEAARARAFEPFFRAPEARASNLPGHGVGLALVAQIARAHGGAAELAPRAAGPGACLRLRLPRWRRL